LHRNSASRTRQTTRSRMSTMFRAETGLKSDPKSIWKPGVSCLQLYVSLIPHREENVKRLLEPHDPAVVVHASKHFRKLAASLRLLLNKRLSAAFGDRFVEELTLLATPMTSNLMPRPSSRVHLGLDHLQPRVPEPQRRPRAWAGGHRSCMRRRFFTSNRRVPPPPPGLRRRRPQPARFCPDLLLKQLRAGRRRASPGRRRADLTPPPTDPSPLLTEV
jgi:hypothetical protein